MSGAQSSFVVGLSCLIQSGTSSSTYPQRRQRCRSWEHRIGSSPFLTGPLAVPNKYQVSPSLAMDGSWVNSTSPSSFRASGVVLEAVLSAAPAVERPTTREKEKRTLARIWAFL